MNPLPLSLSLLQHLFVVTLAFAFALVVVLGNEVPAEVASTTLASQVSVVGRGYQANRLCRANILIAEVMGTLLYYIGAEVILVVNDDVVGWSNMPLKTGMCLKIEVE